MTTSQPVHFIAHLTINDRGLYRDYVKGFFPLLTEHGGRFLTYDDEVLLLEGERDAGRTVLIEFDSEEQLLNWWNSDAYCALAEIRQASCTTHSVIVVHPTPALVTVWRVRVDRRCYGETSDHVTDRSEAP